MGSEMLTHVRSCSQKLIRTLIAQLQGASKKEEDSQLNLIKNTQRLTANNIKYNYFKIIRQFSQLMSFTILSTCRYSKNETFYPPFFKKQKWKAKWMQYEESQTNIFCRKEERDKNNRFLNYYK